MGSSQDYQNRGKLVGEVYPIGQHANNSTIAGITLTIRSLTPMMTVVRGIAAIRVKVTSRFFVPL